MQGTILEDYGTAYEVKFADSQGATIEMLALKSDQFIVVWQAATQTWLSFSAQVSAISERLSEEQQQQVLNFARSLVSQNH